MDYPIGESRADYEFVNPVGETKGCALTSVIIDHPVVTVDLVIDRIFFDLVPKRFKQLESKHVLYLEYFFPKDEHSNVISVGEGFRGQFVVIYSVCDMYLFS